MHEQIDTYLHQCFMVGIYEPYVEVCRRLAELSPCAGDDQKSLLLNSGAEAVENAVKIARAATGRPDLVVLENAFHGRTLLTMTMTHKESYKRGFGPFVQRSTARRPVPVPRRHRPTTRSRRRVACSSDHEVACVVVEPVQGEGGFIVMPDDYPASPRRALPGARRPLRRRRGAVRRRPHRPRLGDRALRRRAGPPRLGQVARRRAPLAAVTGRAEVMDAPDAGGLGGTFGGNPVACAAALAVLDEVGARRVPTPLRGPRRADQRTASRTSRPGSNRSARCEASARCSPSSS